MDHDTYLRTLFARILNGAEYTAWLFGGAL